MMEEDVQASFFGSNHRHHEISTKAPSFSPSVSMYDDNDPWNTNGPVVDVLPAPMNLGSSTMGTNVLMEEEDDHPVNVASLLGSLIREKLVYVRGKHRSLLPEGPYSASIRNLRGITDKPCTSQRRMLSSSLHERVTTPTF
ncbi:hypothetical protein BC936DRAFT_147595 [Jimgerdemannia flammicorona]|uniref:Uncharacterized protein n=2 Tax=Jimgerdemannia flammicorona TaxID=994334 RepID=A0A433QMN7_9FUNG|nr:hypothetical protein BC936DRAFT_147595 [Jimgerdemannia flammicorona]RUS31029.1 hypothetical protein BC938DRAFT_478591 [Jimgerdemannia flammicorona]